MCVCIFSDLGRNFFSYSYLTSLGFVGVFSFLFFFSLSTASAVLLVVM